MPRSRDLAILVPTTLDDDIYTTTDETDCFTPYACARGNKEHSDSLLYQAIE